ncbi:MAG: prepilin-type N-terminal cleavage/methylation domain-containing protein [Deltaproteobacteria bacterium]|nr:prepilin-type N-terminal cleavage/methylation domain-containing protein [Deltaproteobacteria bacterium]
MITQTTGIESRKSDGNLGFSLIEVLIAMAIFAIGILAVGSLQISATNNNASARMRAEATTLASEKAEELMSLPNYDDPLLDTDTHADSSPNNIYCIAWTANIDSPIANAKTITLSVRWSDGETGCANFDQKENQVDIDFIRANL